MFPLYDEAAPRIKKPVVVLSLIVINVIVFFVSFSEIDFERVVFEWGLIPARILGGQGLITLLTAMFLHADLMHLIGNMWFLWLFGDNLEYNLGRLRFLIFYLLAGLVASLVHIFTTSDIFLPVIGASGAISGILGGYVILFPKNKIRAFIVLLFRPVFFSVPAWFYTFVWFAGQMAYVGAPISIAYMAHIGGFIAGVALVSIFSRKIKIKDYA